MIGHGPAMPVMTMLVSVTSQLMGLSSLQRTAGNDSAAESSRWACLNYCVSYHLALNRHRTRRAVPSSHTTYVQELIKARADHSISRAC